MGGGGAGGNGGGGGSSGWHSVCKVAVTPGQVLRVDVGAGGSGARGTAGSALVGKRGTYGTAKGSGGSNAPAAAQSEAPRADSLGNPTEVSFTQVEEGEEYKVPLAGADGSGAIIKKGPVGAPGGGGGGWGAALAIPGLQGSGGTANCTGGAGASISGGALSYCYGHRRNDGHAHGAAGPGRQDRRKRPRGQQRRRHRRRGRHRR
ncbi:hypothetical protein [Streptomyces sp. NPDC056921]|uniref:hypothetical protein n=1 Tax=Streptomyces sp. NPDC056921 TaxID=3345966 RepID=UPI003635F6ED